MLKGTSKEVRGEEEKAKRRAVNTITPRRKRGGEGERGVGNKEKRCAR